MKLIRGKKTRRRKFHERQARKAGGSEFVGRDFGEVIREVMLKNFPADPLTSEQAKELLGADE